MSGFCAADCCWLRAATSASGDVLRRCGSPLDTHTHTTTHTHTPTPPSTPSHPPTHPSAPPTKTNRPSGGPGSQVALLCGAQARARAGGARRAHRARRAAPLCGPAPVRALAVKHIQLGGRPRRSGGCQLAQRRHPGRASYLLPDTSFRHHHRTPARLPSICSKECVLRVAHTVTA